jgi:hypothetical protein
MHTNRIHVSAAASIYAGSEEVPLIRGSVDTWTGVMSADPPALQGFRLGRWAFSGKPTSRAESYVASIWGKT